MSLRLCHFFHMKEHRYVILTRHADALFKNFTTGGIIPSLYGVDAESAFIGIGLHTRQGFGDGAFGGLIFFGNGDAVAIIPHKYRQRHLQYTGGIDGFPKGSFTRGSIPNGSEANLVAFV